MKGSALVLVTSVAALLGCASAASETNDSEVTLDAIRTTDQGWTAEIRNQTRHVGIGSELMPERWFLALEDAGSSDRFAGHLAPFGFFESDAPSAQNQSGLPLGFARDENAETSVLYGQRDWVGLTCAGCHTATLKIGPNRVRLEGGPARVDLVPFQNALLAAVDATLGSDEKFARFARAVGDADIAGETRPLRDRLQAFASTFAARIARSPDFAKDGVVVRTGPGRMDGFGVGTNETLCKLAELGSAELRAAIENPANCAAMQPPASIPYLWGATKLEYVLWTGNVHSALGRNVGAVTGVYGNTWVTADDAGGPVMHTTARLGASLTVDGWLDQLKSPSWRTMARDGLVPPLDDTRATRGQAIFGERCASCHAAQPELSPASWAGLQYRKDPVYTAAEVGTDATHLEVFAARKATLPAAFVAPFTASFGAVGPNNEVSATQYRGFVIGNMIFNELGRENAFAQVTQLTECRDDRAQPKLGYRARSLEGVVFTAPYLHNGSVPTLDDLLKPPAERPTTFRVGCETYDVQRLGYDCEGDPSLFVFDTSLPANSNAGHEFGTDLAAEDRRALLEYLKSLEEPPPPPRPTGAPCPF